jgi:hypothetical protein
MKQYASLGTAAVLDADLLRPGMHTEINGEILVVEKIVDGVNVYFRPLTKWEKVQYRWSNFSTTKKTFVSLLVLMAVGLLYYWLNGVLK